ncbi:MAG: hypothetical protein ACO1RT_03235 [Planctomycetaceae bacterium]
MDSSRPGPEDKDTHLSYSNTPGRFRCFAGKTTRRSIGLALIVSGWLFWEVNLCSARDVPPANADAPPLAEPVLNEDAALAAIEQDLRSQNFDRRQLAMMRLWSNRERYRSWVEKAATDADPEVARRAHWILDRWRRGLLPDTPPDIAEQLQAAASADTIESLLNAGLFDGALVAIDEAIGGGGGEAVLDRAKSALRKRFPFYVRAAYHEDQLVQLVEVLGRLADEAPMALAYQQLRKHVLRDDGYHLPPASVRWTSDQREKLEVILLAANDDLPAAIDKAAKATDRDLLRVCRMLGGDWQALAHEQLAAANAQTPDSLEWYRHWMYALMAAARCEETDIRRQAVEQLSKPRGADKDLDQTDPINRVRWQALAMHGELQAAASILQPLQPNDAAELLAQATLYPQAFEAIDVDWTQIDSQLSSLVKEAVQGEQKESDANRVSSSPELSRLLTVVRMMIATGRDELALEALKSVVNHPSLSSRDNASATRIEIIRTLARLNRNEWISELLIGPADTTLPGRTQFYLAMAFDAEIETVAGLIEAFTRLRPTDSFAEHVRDTVAILDGRLPKSFAGSGGRKASTSGAGVGFESLYAAMAESKRVIRTRDGGMSIASVPRLTLDMARIFELHGEPELARRTLMALAAQGESEATLRIAEAELNQGSAQTARQLFETVWKTIERRGTDLSRLNQADADSLVAMKAIQGEATSAMRLGDLEGAEELQTLIKLMSCTPSPALRDSFAQYLVEQQMHEPAAAIYGPLLRLAAFGSSDDVEFYSIARNYDAAVSESKPAQAAAMLDLAIAGTIETTVFYPAAYISLPSYLHRRVIQMAVQDQDAARVRAHVEQLFRLDPIDIDFGEKVLVAMREAGMKDLAAEILERIYQAGNRHLETFPLDVGMANNLAWVLALSDHRLEDALRLSRRAVFYEPDSTIYRDTLAEVLFRLDRKPEAIAIEKACLLDDPAEWHVHEQIKRFEASAPTAVDR